MKKTVTLLEHNNYEDLQNAIDTQILEYEKEDYTLETVDVKPFIYMEGDNRNTGETYYLATLVFKQFEE